jgi:glutathione S-transferase
MPSGLTLYYSPSACSLGAHIALEEIGEPFEAVQIRLAEDEHHSSEYRAINPRARVPALKVGDKVLTECPAILYYLARAFPGARLWPQDAWSEGQALSWMSFLATTVHIAFAQILRPGHTTDETAAHPAVQAGGRAAALRHFTDINARLTGSEWVLGGQYSVVDPYLLVFYLWGERIGLPLDEVPTYAKLAERVMQRPATRRAFAREGLRGLA